ncbi:SDR family NAD(P)-dependent oxidoreductase [Undibacterium squillarum]|uniref:SDR family NAD(P)-dependent oxidoreductase n=1 Tax=Undibacterium squillarum TaxID=1131567 RepID=UPI0035B0091E
MSKPKVAIITGSSRGIGTETAKLFAAHGYAVCINYRKDQAAAEAVSAEISAAGGRCIVEQADVSVAAEVKSMFDQTEAAFGPVTVLVNNAAILQQQCSFTDISEERFSEILRSNVISCFLCCKEAVLRMSTKRGGNGGAIVNVSSGATESVIKYPSGMGFELDIPQHLSTLDGFSQKLA